VSARPQPSSVTAPFIGSATAPAVWSTSARRRRSTRCCMWAAPSPRNARSRARASSAGAMVPSTQRVRRLRPPAGVARRAGAAALLHRGQRGAGRPLDPRRPAASGVHHLLVFDRQRTLLGLACRCDLARGEGREVSEVMSSDVFAVEPATPLGIVAAALKQLQIGCLPVVSGPLVFGIATRSRSRRRPGLNRPAPASTPGSARS